MVEVITTHVVLLRNGQEPRLTLEEADAILQGLLLEIEPGNASRPAIPVYWTRQKLEN